MFCRRLNIRNFSTTRIKALPALSADYKSPELWETRFNCPLLTDGPRIRIINSKILLGDDLDNLELDIFINVAASRSDEITFLQETVGLLRKFRKSLYAHTMLPSSHHGTCRLFLDSKRLPSLISILENRIDFGIFPDAYSLNLIFDDALKDGQLSLATRAAALIMLQEEFGLSKLTDSFALYSTAKYIESKTDFSDWIGLSVDNDPVFNLSLKENVDSQTEDSERSGEEAKEEEAEEDEEDDAEYLRVPFLRNPYNDNHFDLDKPRLICGKILSMLGLSVSESKGSEEISIKCKILGSILQGRWIDAGRTLDEAARSKVVIDSLTKDLVHHYLSDLSGTTDAGGELDDKSKSAILSRLDKTQQNSGCPLSELAENEFATHKDAEQKDIKWLRRMTSEWSSLRLDTLKVMQEIETRKRLVEEIRAKKDELRRKEEYLNFYDNLKREKLTRIDYN